MNTVGIFPGKFLPLHIGHIKSILTASLMVDRLYVIGSYRYDERTIIYGIQITPPIIHKWLQETFKDVWNVHCKVIDETDLPCYPDGWVGWTALIKNAISPDIEFIDAWDTLEGELPEDTKGWYFINDDEIEPVKLYMFGGEPEYEDNYLKYFYPCQYIVLDPDRTKHQIHATWIRENLSEYWDCLSNAAKETFKEVL